MRRPRFQFRLSTLLWITLAVACWFGGATWEQRRMERRDQELLDTLEYLPILSPMPQEMWDALKRQDRKNRAENKQ